MTKRRSNLELLRIFSILLIITFHYAYKGGFDFGGALSGNMLLIKTCWMFGEVGVNLFVLLTGYFMVHGAFRWKKLVLLLAQVLFYHIATIIIFAHMVGSYEISDIKGVFTTFFPVLSNRYWFITAYIILYVLSPYLNKLIHALSQTEHRRLLATLLLLFCAIPTVFGAVYNTTETLLYYNRLIWLGVVYLMGAYIRLYGTPAIETPAKAAGLSAASFGFLVVSIVALQKYSGFFETVGIKEPAYFWPPNTVPIVCLSVGIFGLFLQLRVSDSQAINKLASTTLGIYILHDGLLNRWLWRTVFKNASYQESPLLFLHMVVTVAVIFFAGAGIDLVRQAVEKRTLRRLLESPVAVRGAISIRNNVKKRREELLMKKKKLRQEAMLAQWLWTAAFACSFTLLAFYQIIRDEGWVTAVTVAVAFPCGVLLFQKTWEELVTYWKSHPKTAVLLLAAAVALVYAMYQVKGIPNKATPFPPFSLRLFRLRYWLLAAPAVFYLLTWLTRRLEDFLRGLWAGMEQGDKRLYLWAAVALSCLVIVFYQLEPQWYLQYDKVYSIDSGWVYKNLYPQMAYYDIRHPILSVLTFPLWALIRGALGLFVPANLLDGLCVTCVQLVNVQLLLLTGAMVTRLSKSRWTFPLYLVCLPTLSFAMFFEKYQLCVFLLVLYAYLVCQKKERTGLALTMATGAMPTSVLLFTNELFIKEPLAQKAKRALGTAVCGVLVLVCAGRAHLLAPRTLLAEMANMAQIFGLKDLPIVERAASFVNMVQGAFLPLTSNSGEKYLWADVTHSVSLIGCVLLVVILIGMVAERRDSFVRLCAVWTAVGVVLFGVVQWGVGESPLFSIYFGWALLVLFQKGLQWIAGKLRWREETVYPAVLAVMLVVNVWAMMDIGRFLKTL